MCDLYEKSEGQNFAIKCDYVMMVQLKLLVSFCIFHILNNDHVIL